MSKSTSASDEAHTTLAPYRAMFNAEVEQATTELRRPARALFASGTVAGASVAMVILLLGTVLSQGQTVPGPVFRLTLGAIYAIGFTLAIMARTDLFTEYTTISVLPLLTGDSSLSAVARLWTLVYTGNLFGAFAIALLGVTLGPELRILAAEDLVGFGHHLSAYEWWVILLSGIAAGWLMGLLSWLIAGGRDTTSQILFIWIIGVMIGFLGLHHAITGGTEMMAAAMGSSEISARDVLYVLGWTTAGNAIGGVGFAAVIQQAVRMGSQCDYGGERKRQQEDAKSRREAER